METIPKKHFRSPKGPCQANPISIPFIFNNEDFMHHVLKEVMEFLRGFRDQKLIKA